MPTTPDPKKPVRRQRPDKRRDKDPKNDWVINYLLIVSSLVWVANFIFGIVIESYKGSETVNAVFIAVIGGVFTLRTRKKDDEE